MSGSHRPTISPLHRACAAAALLAVALLAGCAASRGTDPFRDFDARLDALPRAELLLFGEQHDAPEHHALERRFVEGLAQRGRLAAVAMEMADTGRDTRSLPRDATPDQVQQALAWNTTGWPWERYGPTVMAAVRAGIPVLGANLPRADMRGAMSQSAYDTHLPPAALAEQREAIRTGHCDMLPATQIGPMTRVQIARDAAMARTAAAAVAPGKTVLLIAGGGHVRRSLGVPTHVPANVRAVVVLAVAGTPLPGDAADADVLWTTPALPPVDHCAALQRQFSAPKPAP